MPTNLYGLTEYCASTRFNSWTEWKDCCFMSVSSCSLHNGLYMTLYFYCFRKIKDDRHRHYEILSPWKCYEYTMKIPWISFVALPLGFLYNYPVASTACKGWTQKEVNRNIGCYNNGTCPSRSIHLMQVIHQTLGDGLVICVILTHVHSSF